MRARLRRFEGLTETAPVDGPVNDDGLARAAIAADPRVVQIARERGREVAFSNGGTELGLARESAVHNAKNVVAVVAFDTRAFGAGASARLVITAAAPISLARVAEAGLGRDHLDGVRLEHGRVLARIERIYAKRVIATREEVPTGEVARAALRRNRREHDPDPRYEQATKGNRR